MHFFCWWTVPGVGRPACLRISSGRPTTQTPCSPPPRRCQAAASPCLSIAFRWRFAPSGPTPTARSAPSSWTTSWGSSASIPIPATPSLRWRPTGPSRRTTRPSTSSWIRRPSGPTASPSPPMTTPSATRWCAPRTSRAPGSTTTTPPRWWRWRRSTTTPSWWRRAAARPGWISSTPQSCGPSPSTITSSAPIGWSSTTGPWCPPRAPMWWATWRRVNPSPSASRRSGGQRVIATTSTDSTSTPSRCRWSGIAISPFATSWKGR